MEPGDVNTDNDDDEEVELEAWKQRELNRIKMERLDLSKEPKDNDGPSQTVLTFGQ